MNDDRVFYGPYLCRCGNMICRASHEQGGEKFDYPTGPIYPNTPWLRHNCEVQPLVTMNATIPE